MNKAACPQQYQKCEVLVGGHWLPATFHECDYYFDGEEEIWWFDHFALDDGSHESVPEAQSDGPLPPWRPLTKEEWTDAVRKSTTGGADSGG